MHAYLPLRTRRSSFCVLLRTNPTTLRHLAAACCQSWSCASVSDDVAIGAQLLTSAKPLEQFMCLAQDQPFHGSPGHSDAHCLLFHGHNLGNASNSGNGKYLQKTEYLFSLSQNGGIISLEMCNRNGIIISPRRNGREISRPCFGNIILLSFQGVPWQKFPVSDSLRCLCFARIL